MAVLLQFTVTPATQDQFNELDAKLEEVLMQSGPPVGLMSHVVYPDHDGFVVSDVWSTEADAQPFVRDLVPSLLAQVGLTAGETAVLPVWSFACP